MNDFLISLKADLLDRRLLPLVALVAAGLIAAIAYTVLGGGGSSATPTAALSSGPASASSGIAISQSDTEKAVAETTSGGSAQHGGKVHNPFTPLPEPKAKKAAATNSPIPNVLAAADWTGSAVAERSGSKEIQR